MIKKIISILRHIVQLKHDVSNSESVTEYLLEEIPEHAIICDGKLIKEIKISESPKVQGYDIYICPDCGHIEYVLIKNEKPDASHFFILNTHRLFESDLLFHPCRQW